MSERRVLEQDLPVEDNMDVKDPYEEAQGREAIYEFVLATEDFSSEDITVSQIQTTAVHHVSRCSSQSLK